MKAHAAAPGPGQPVELDVFCAVSSDGEFYRVYVRRTWMPDCLREIFDDNCEAYPVYLDFEDLDYHMQKSGVTYTRRQAKSGSVQLYAEGPAATVLSLWLMNSVSSRVRTA